MKRNTMTVIAATALAGVPLTVLLAAPVSSPVQVKAGSLPFVRTVDDRFQSFQIGFSHLTGGETWKAYDAMPKSPTRDFAAIREPRGATDLANRRLLNLTKALSPLYLRYSGTTANSVYFHDSDAPPPATTPEGYTVMLTRQRWKDALVFAKAVDAKVLTSFANSEGVRDKADGWTPKMAIPWMNYTKSIGGEIYAAELFNEPNAPERPQRPKGFDAKEFGRDYAAFRAAMATAAPNVKIAGPGNAILGIGGVSSILGTSPEQYAAATPKPGFDIVSYHFYPALAQRCAPPMSPQGVTEDKALTEEFLARPDKAFQQFKALRDRDAPGAPIWLTETGGAACGGLTWQQTFLDMFRYVDTQARLAKQGLDAMFTHALISGSNGVIDEKTLQPNASYWAAVLWRRTMDANVLDAGENKPGLHLYAHCQRGTKGGVTLLAINMATAPRSVGVSGPADVYALTAPDMKSRTVMLNGRTLAVTADDTLPAMTPIRSSGRQVTLAPSSVNFITLPKAGNAKCNG